MICKRCGSPLPSKGYICKSCGMLMDEKQIIEQKEYLKNNKDYLKTELISEKYGQKQIFKKRDEVESNYNIILILGVIIFIIILIAFIVYFL